MPTAVRAARGVHLRRTGPVTWGMVEAAAPYTAFLNDDLVDHIMGDGDDKDHPLLQSLAVSRLPFTDLVLNTPDMHTGKGATIGTVYVSPATLSLPVIGVDISCGMALLITRLRRRDLRSRDLRKEILARIAAEIPMGMGVVRDNTDVVADPWSLIEAGIEALDPKIIRRLGITPAAFEFIRDLRGQNIKSRIPSAALGYALKTLGSLGGGNHFCELQYVEVVDEAVAATWGLEPDQVSLMLHSGSRKFGFEIADYYAKASRGLFEAGDRARKLVREVVITLRNERCAIERRQVPHAELTVDFAPDDSGARISYTVPAEAELAETRHKVLPVVDEPTRTLMWDVALEANEDAGIFDPAHLAADLPYVHRPLPDSGIAPASKEATEIAEGYWQGVLVAQNFAALSRTLMLYRAAGVLEEVFGATKVGGRLLYDINHNTVQLETFQGKQRMVHRKGATRAFPAGHPALDGTPWATTGHPIITPSSMGTPSYLMRAGRRAADSCYSVNHGSGRLMSRGEARRTLDRAEQEALLLEKDIVVHGFSLDEAPGAYKSGEAVIDVLVRADLADVVARVHPMACAKGDDEKDD